MFKKHLESLLAKLFATKEEKVEVKELFENLNEEKKKEVKELYEKVLTLSEEDPEAEKKELDETEKKVKELFEKVAGSLKSDLEKEVLANLSKSLKEKIAEQLELAKNNAGLQNKEVKRDRKAMSTWVREFTKSLLKNDMATLKEMTTDATGSPYAGYTVDAELSAEIRHLQTEYGVARREMMGVQLSKNSYKANDLATDLSVFWADEGGSISSTQVVLGQEDLELKKMCAIVSFTNELLEDTEIDLVGFVIERIAENFAEKEDEAFFNGDGTSTYGGFTGLLIADDINEVTLSSGSAFTSMTGDDLIRMIDATPAGALTGAKFYMHRSVFNIVRTLKDSNNQYIYQKPSENGPGTIWGYPVVIVEVMPTRAETSADTSFVLFGDLRKACIFGYKGAIKSMMAETGTIRNVADSADINLFTTDRKAIRWTQRVGYIRIIPTAVTKLTTNTTSA